MSSSTRAAGLVLCGFVALAGSADAKVFHTQNEAQALAFPEADRVETQTSILTDAQEAEIQKIARSKLDSRIVQTLVGYKGDLLLGYAYIDVHTVRTLPEAFLIVLDANGAVRSLRVLAFHEPLDYMPTERWYEQFNAKSIDQPLRLGRDIHGIVGATLSARAVTDSVRRTLALYEVLVHRAGARD